MTCRGQFTRNDGRKVPTTFYTTTMNLRHSRRIVNDVHYDFIVVPCAYVNYNYSSERVMIYVIPRKCVEVARLWEALEGIFHSGIKHHVLSNLKTKLVSLSLPRQHGFMTNVDTYEIFSQLCDGFKPRDVTSTVFTKSIISLRLEKFANIQSENPGNKNTEKIIVKANVPYLSFLYDLHWRRTLYVYKDDLTSDS